jgi:hypothetical protein
MMNVLWLEFLLIATVAQICSVSGFKEKPRLIYAADRSLQHFHRINYRIWRVSSEKTIMKAKDIKVIVLRDMKPRTLSTKLCDVTFQTIKSLIMT